MSPLSCKILNALECETDYISSEELARRVGMSARGLRGEDGPLAIAAREIYNETGFIIVRRMKQPAGIRITKDRDEVEEAYRQWLDWFSSFRPQLDFYRDVLNRNGQYELVL